MAAATKATVVEKAVDRFLQSLRQRNASVHTIKAYRGDLDEFAAYVGSRGWKQIDHVTIRGFLSHLYEKGLGKTSVARSLAAVRSLYRWLAQEGVVEQNPAALVSTPKLPKKLPRVPTIEEMNGVLDGKMPEIAAFPERDRLMLELLYGCGIRNSELIGINLDDIRLSAEAILIRGKGKKERYVPFGDSVKVALAAYLPVRQQMLANTKKNNARRCWSIGGVDGLPPAAWDASSRKLPLPKGYRLTFTRTLYAMPSGPTCWRKAPICAPSRKCSATSAFPPPNATPSSPSNTCFTSTTRPIREPSKTRAEGQ